MRTDHDDAAFGLRQQAGDRGGREGRANDAAGRHGGEGFEIEACRRLEALFGVGGGERVAEGQIEVHRAGQRALRALPSIDQQLAPVTEQGEVGAGHGGLGGPDGIAAEDAVLGDGLAGVAFAQLRRTVGREHDQRRGRHARLDHRRQVVGDGGAGGAEQGGGTAGRLGDAEGDEAGRTLIERDRYVQVGGFREGVGHRSRARAGRDHHVREAEAAEGAYTHVGPEGVRVQVLRRASHRHRQSGKGRAVQRGLGFGFQRGR